MSTITAASKNFKSNGSNNYSAASQGSDNNGLRDPLDTNFVEIKSEARMERAPPRYIILN